jgi:hypothetical protein
VIPESETRRIDSALTGGAQKAPAKPAAVPVETR